MKFLHIFHPKIFRNQIFKLPDKGERIKSLLERIRNELNARNEVDLAAEMFSDLNIASKGLKKLTEMEWTGGKATVPSDAVVDSDDNDDGQNVDPLKIIAQSRDLVKTVKVVKPESSLITAADLEEIKSFEEEREKESGNESISSTNSIHLEPHAVYICDKDQNAIKIKKNKFQPHKTTRSDVHNIEKEKSRTQGKKFEITAATPPKLRNNATQLLTLQESIVIEQKHKEELKQLMEKQAIDRLEARKKLVDENLSLLPPGSSLMDPNEFFENYRTTNGYDSDDSFSDNSYNGEDTEIGGVVVHFD